MSLSTLKWSPHSLDSRKLVVIRNRNASTPTSLQILLVSISMTIGSFNASQI